MIMVMSGRISSLLRIMLMLVLAALSACRKQGLTAPLPQEPVQFSCRQVEVSTKADASYVTDDMLVSGNHFAVYAWDTSNEFLSANPVTDFGAPALMSQLDVTYQNNNDKGKNNTYAGDYFWPLTTTPPYCYSFLAYYPYAAGSGITAPVFSDGNVGVYAFTAKGESKDMVDFCVSDVSNDIVYGTTYTAYPGTVGLTFRHTLTRVQVKFVKAADVDEDTHLYIEDAHLVNIRKQGTLTATYAQFIDDVSDPGNPQVLPGYGRKGTTTLNWATDPDVKGDYELSIGGVNPDPAAVPDPVDVELDYTQTVRPDEVFLMVPQAILKENEPLGSPSPQAITFRWRVGSAPASDATLILDDCVKAVGSAERAGITEWAPNMSVVYTVVIKAKPIEFAITASIRAWDDEDGYYTIIP